MICGEYHGAEKSESVPVNELLLSSLRGIDLAFAAYDEITIEGPMPDGTRNAVRARIVRPEAFILIKAFAMADRMKEKDGYDVAFVLHHYQPNLKALAERVESLLSNGLAQEGLGILEEKFATIDSIGPVAAAQSIPGTGYDQEQERRAAFEDAQELFRHIRAGT